MSDEKPAEWANQLVTQVASLEARLALLTKQKGELAEALKDMRSECDAAYAAGFKDAMKRQGYGQGPGGGGAICEMPKLPLDAADALKRWQNAAWNDAIQVAFLAMPSWQRDEKDWDAIEALKR